MTVNRGEGGGEQVVTAEAQLVIQDMQEAMQDHTTAAMVSATDSVVMMTTNASGQQVLLKDCLWFHNLTINTSLLLKLQV